MDLNLLDVLQHLDPAMLDYSEWTQVGMALKEEGYTAHDWDTWSKRDPGRHKAGECYKKWDSFGQYTGDTVKAGTIVALAKEQGWTPSGDDGNRVLDWNDSISAVWVEDYTVISDPGWLEDQEVTEPQDDWDQVSEVKTYLETLFQPDDFVGYVMDAWQDEDGKWRPSSSGSFSRTAAQLLADIDHYKKDTLSYALGDANPESGVWIRFNPLDGSGVYNSNVTRFKYALVESDSLSIERQNTLLRELELPIALMVHSGGKSLHAIVNVDAHNEREYRERVDFLYKVCEQNGLALDKQNKNPSRLSRFPGFFRGEHKQYIVAKKLGKESFAEWQEWIEELNDDLPDPESLDTVWDNLPDLAPSLIEGVLRQGHKMLLAGPSKAGKSFALIQLCIAIAEGRQWMGWQCAKGKVMYINLELDRASALHRFKDVYHVLGIEPRHIGDIHIWNLRGKSAPLDKLAPKLIRRAREQGYIAVILDPIYKVITGDENSADQMAHFTNQFDLIANELGSAVIYCHHLSKGYQGQKRSMDRASGSGVFARDPDALIDMTELEFDDKVIERLRMFERTRLIGEAVYRIDPNYYRYTVDPDDLDDRDRMMRHFESALTGAQQAQESAEIDRHLSQLDQRTAWRLEGTLREYASFKPRDIWFSYPQHLVDIYGALSDCTPEAEKSFWEKGRKAQKTPEEREEQRANELEIAYTTLELEDPDEPITIKRLEGQMGYSYNTVRSRILEHGGFILEDQGPGLAAHVVRGT